MRFSLVALVPGELRVLEEPSLLQVDRGVGGPDRVGLHLYCEIFPIGWISMLGL